MNRVIGKQHRIARGILKAGQLAGEGAERIGQIHLADKHPVGSMIKGGLKGFSTLAPRLSVIAESAGDIKSAGEELREGYRTKNLEKTLGAGAKLYRIGEKVSKTKEGDVVLKDRRRGKMAMDMDASEPPKEYGGSGGFLMY
jgi:hypothetical protein